MFIADQLYKAIVLGDAATVESLLQDGYSPNTEDSDGFTPLMHAVLVEPCSESVVTLLIRAGANVNAQDYGQHWTALAFAARDGKVKICEILLAAGAEVDSLDTFRNTPLWRAAMGRKTDVIELLIKHGANPTLPNRRGISARDLLGGS